MISAVFFSLITILGVLMLFLPKWKWAKQDTIRDYFLSLFHRGKYKRKWWLTWINVASIIGCSALIIHAFINDGVKTQIKQQKANIECLAKSSNDFNNKQPTYVVNGCSNKIISVSVNNEPERFILIKPKKITDSYVKGGTVITEQADEKLKVTHLGDNDYKQFGNNKTWTIQRQPKGQNIWRKLVNDNKR